MRVATDRNFDDLSHKFGRNIYQSPKGVIRQEIVWEDLLDTLPDLHGRPLRILDAGAGMGQVAMRLALLGHEVVLCDHSSEMLNLAAAAFAESAPEANVRFIHAPVQQLSSRLHGDFDLVLFHAVLEWLAEPQQTLLEVLRYCRPGGHFSLLFYNRHGLAYLNLIKGNLRKVAASDFSGHPGSLTPTHPHDPAEVQSWLEQAGWDILRKSGVRVFYDLMPPQVRAERSIEDVLVLERALARQMPYSDLGRYVHLVCARHGAECV